MLIIELSSIPAEGLDLDEPLDPAPLHLEGEEGFALRPAGHLRCHVERVDGHSFHVRGHLAAGLDLECNRCLEPFVLPVEQDLDLFYLPHREGEPDEEEDEVELQDHEMVVAYHDGARLDLGEMVRELFILSVPMKRLCREGCRGRCPSCGADRNAGSSCPCPAPKTEVDPRLASLRELFPKDSD